MRMCLNRKVIIGLAVVALGVLAIDPHLFIRVLPVLFIAICPLSMLLMVRGMRGMSGNKTSGGMGSYGMSQTPQGAQGGMAEGSAPADAEVARLRAELDQLRAERSAAQPQRFALPVPDRPQGGSPAAS